MMHPTLCATLCYLALANGFMAPHTQQSRSTALNAFDNKNVRNPTDKASRFRVDRSEEGKTAAAAFREPTPQKSGGGGLFGLFGGGSTKKANPVEKAASAAKGAVNGAAPKANVRNPKDKASRFRVDQEREEGQTSARAFRQPSPSRGPQNSSSQSWSVPAKFTKGDSGPSGQSIQSRAEQYMRGAISARDFAATLRSKNIANPEELIGSMPEGQKRSALFKMFTQL